MPTRPRARCSGSTTCPHRATYRGRCAEHAREHERERGTAAERGYDADWRRRVAEAIASHPFCAVCGSTEDLTGDHPTPLANGGSRDQTPVVLCRPCNSRKGNRTV